MLENAYPYCLVQKEQGDNSGLRQILLYHFKSTKSHLIYMVRVEVYDYDVYAVKFYLKKHSLSPNKYRLMAQTYEPRRIINTCITLFGNMPILNNLQAYICPHGKTTRVYMPR
jgi:hypothetical protein